MKLEHVILRPVVTEKSNIAREQRNVVTFAVDPKATKHEIARAVEELFRVDVVDVHTLRMPHKTRRVGRFVGRKPQWKKAMVKLAPGQTIELFEGV